MRVGWIGLGAMGLPMARRVVAAGHDLVVYARRSDLPDVGAVVERAGSPAEVASRTDVVCTIVGTPADVEQVYVGQGGLLDGRARASWVVDHTTSDPALARRLAIAARAVGIVAIDAPVSGGPFGAESGTLTMMVGGSRPALEAVRPVLSATAAMIVHHGSAGSGQAAKLANQSLVAITMLGIAEVARLSDVGGLDPTRVGQSISAGVAGSPLFDWAWARIMAGDRRPGFRVEHLVKDLELAGGAMPSPLLALALRHYRELVAAGFGADGTQVVAMPSPMEEPGR